MIVKLLAVTYYLVVIFTLISIGRAFSADPFAILLGVFVGITVCNIGIVVAYQYLKGNTFGEPLVFGVLLMCVALATGIVDVIPIGAPVLLATMVISITLSNYVRSINE